MVKLPIYEQQVQPDTAVIPSAPKNTGNPGLVLSSMNKNAEAVQNAAQAVGDVGQKLYAHAQKLQTLQLKKKNAELDTQFRQDLQDKLYSPDNEVVKINGADVERPIGIYNRSLKQAEGSKTEFDEYYATTRQKYLSQVTDPDAQLALANSLDNQYFSARDNVISHEAKQMREDLVNGFKSNISQQIKDAANSTDLKSLTESVNNAVETQKSLNEALGLDSATAKLAEQKTIADVIESSTSAALMNDLSGATSMKLLDAAKPVLDAKDYDELASGIKVKSKKIIEDTKASVKLAKNINSTKILMEVADGNFSVFNVKELNRMANNGEISNEAATAAIRAIEKPISDYDIKPDDEAFMQRAKGIFEASNPADMEKNLIDVLDGFSSGSLSQERMTLLFQAAKGQGSEKATAYRENFKKIYDWGVDAGVPVTYQSQVAKDYVEGINAGKDPVEAAEVAIKRASASQNEGVGADNLRVSENPKENIGFSDRVMTSPVMNTLFEGLTKFSQNRAVKVIGLGQAGMVEGVGGAAKLVGLKDFGEAVSKESKLMQKTFEIKDPTFLDKLGMGASSSLSFFVPGLAVAKGVNMLRAAPVIAVALGVSTSSVMESSIEAGNNYEEAKRRGMTDEQAKQVGGVTFWLNMPLLVGTNVLGGLFNPEGQAVKEAGKKMTVDRIINAVAEKGVKPAVAEGTQEGLQQVSQNVAIGDPALQGAREAAVIGAIVGSGLGAVTSFDSGAKTKDVPTAKTEAPAVKTDAPIDNTVKDSTGKPLEINTEADKISQEIAVKKAVVAQAVAGVETIENGGNSKEVALNSRLAGNLEIINGFNNADVKIEAAKDIERALFEYFMQDGKSKEEAAVMAQNISQQATQELMKTQNTEKFREALIKVLQETIPTWRLTAPDTLTVNEAGETAQEVAKNEADKLKQLNILREYEFSRGNTENVKKIDAMIEKQTARMAQQGTKSVESTIAEGEKIVKDGGINGKPLPSEDLNIIDQSVADAKKTVQGGDLSVKNEKTGKEVNANEKGLQVNADPGATPARVLPTGTVKKSAAYQRALERYTEELKGQPEANYTTINLADQMARAIKFVDENPKLAKKIAYGMEPAPSGLRESAVSIAYNEKMYQEGNMGEFGKSYRSRSLRQTARGQEIVLEKAAEVNQNHPLYFARQVIEARTAQIGKKLFEISKDSKTEAPVKRALKKMNEKTESLKKEIVDSKTLDITEAQKIIDSLIC